MMFQEDPVQDQLPVLECGLTASEIHELLSLIQSGQFVSVNSGSETNRRVYSMEERKRRRMISNRESARRSRWRKKRHLENLTTQLNHLRVENRELKKRLFLVTHEFQAVRRESDRLLAESIYLQQKLSGLYRFMDITQLQ